jgi:hypothetical protein
MRSIRCAAPETYSTAVEAITHKTKVAKIILTWIRWSLKVRAWLMLRLRAVADLRLNRNEVIDQVVVDREGVVSVHILVAL